MRDRMERFILLPFSISCVSESSIAVIDNRKKKPLINTDHSTSQKDEPCREEEEMEKRMRNSSGFLSLQKLMKSFRDLTAQIFSAKEDEQEKEEMEIGFPTDVQHVGHIGWDGSSKGSQFLSQASSISFRQFELAMVSQEDCSGKGNLHVA